MGKKRSWWKRALKRVVQVVATAINPAVGIAISVALEILLDTQERSLGKENPIVERTVTKWIDTIFLPYITKLSQNLNVGEFLQELTNQSRIDKLNFVLKDLATLKVYLDLEASKSTGDLNLMYQYKSETVDFFIKNISEGYVQAVKKAIETSQGNNVVVNFITKREEFEASKQFQLGHIPLRWYGSTVLAQYTAFTKDFTSTVIDGSKPISDPIILPPPPPPPPPINDPVVDTGGSDSGSGPDSGTNIPTDNTDNGTVKPMKDTGSIPWKWIAGGLVAYMVLKPKK